MTRIATDPERKSLPRMSSHRVARRRCVIRINTWEQKYSANEGTPQTDDIAHSDAAYGGSGANPEESAEGIERKVRLPYLGFPDQGKANPRLTCRNPNPAV